MEYCPEIAVFQAALQLIDKQTNGHFPSLTKADSQLFMKIIQTAVTEICSGLEQDNSKKEAENWNQKLNVLCLYSVIVHNYRDPAKKQLDRVPVCSNLDVLAGMLPKFGSTFYFEVVKTCSWSQHFLECLEYIDRDTALSVLNDYLQHSTSEPIDTCDAEAIPMVTDKILANCLNLPVVIETSMSNLLVPVTRQKKYVQIMYPDDKNYDKEAMKKEETIKDLEKTTFNGEKLWDSFVGKCPVIILDILDFFEKFLEQEDKKDAYTQNLYPGEIWDKVSKIFLFWYLYMLSTSKHEVYVEDDWFANNLFVRNNQEANSEPVSQVETKLDYCINLVIVKKICDSDYENRLMDIVWRSFELIGKYSGLDNNFEDSLASEAKEKSDVVYRELGGQNIDLMKSDTDNVQNVIEQGVCVLQFKTEQVFVKKEILWRMVEKSLREKSNGDIKPSLPYNHADIGTEYSYLVLGSDWSRDVTIDALLWRIENRLYKYESCLQTLLSQSCWPFWKLKRVYEVMKTSTSLLTKKTYVKNCISILEYLLKQQNGAPVHDMRDVVNLSFCGMTVHDKDTFVAAMYIERHLDMKKLLGFDAPDIFTRQIVNVFNKVTSESDQQILDQIFLLCLMDPVSVLDTVLQLTLKSEDQAMNLAKVFCSMPETCQTKHPLHHPDTCLMVMMIDKFLKSTTPSEKEEKHFLIFVNTLMKKTNKSCPLPPEDFITSSLIDAVDSRNFRASHHPIKCGFALSLLILAIESGSKMNCDWLKNEFEPTLLIVSLAGILHECTEIWGAGDDSIETSNGSGNVTMVTGYQKIDMKEKVLAFLDLVVDMVQDGSMKLIDNESIYWLQAVTEDLNWIVRVTLAKCLYKLGYIQAFAQWLKVFEDLRSNILENLPTILMMCVTDVKYIDEIDTEYGDNTFIQYEDLITALIQILPNLLIDEVHTLTDVVEMFLVKGLVNVYYRSTTLSAIILTDLTSIKPVLCLSQILRDVIITLNVVQGQQKSMLKHVMQNYSTIMKGRRKASLRGNGLMTTFSYVKKKFEGNKANIIAICLFDPRSQVQAKCNQSFQTAELRAFTLSNIFQHVCVVTDTLPQECVDNGLVLLLHLLTEFKDITKVKTEVKVQAKNTDAVKKGNSGLNPKMVKNTENAMRSSVERLSDDHEEKHMLLKKLSES